MRRRGFIAFLSGAGRLLLAALILSGAGGSPAFAEFAVTTMADNAVICGPIAFTWSAPTGSATQDWIGFCAVGAPDESCVSALYTMGTSTGNAQVTAPATPGVFEFRYFLNNTYVKRATSLPVTVTNATVLTVNARRVSTGVEEISVKWSSLPADTKSTAWIGLYKLGTPNGPDNPAIRWAYTNSLATGTWSTIAPGAPGDYEFRYFVDERYAMKAKSPAFTVASPAATPILAVDTSATGTRGPVSVTWSAPSGNPKAWIGLFNGEEIFPKRLDAQHWVNWPAGWESGIRAGVRWNNDKVFFFKGGQYLRYDLATDRVDDGYPKPIAGNWPGFPQSWSFGVDAAVDWGNGKMYFFKGRQYLRYDLKADRVDDGFPKPLDAQHWPNWPAGWQSGIGAGVRWNSGKVFFFKGGQYLRYDLAADRVDDGYPKPIAGNWPGFPQGWSSGVDAAVNWKNGKVYFFKGGEYLSYDVAADRVDDGNVKWTYTRGFVEGTFTTNVAAAGKYEFRYFSAQQTKTATSRTIVVHDRSAVWSDSVVTEPRSVIQAHWNAAGSEWTPNAQIGLYVVGADDRTPLQVRPASAPRGTTSFAAPAAAGEYELRYFKDNEFSKNATSTALRNATLGVGTTQSKIKNIIVIMQENHSFDSYFGHYCTAPTGSNPTCTTGAPCCEAGPATTPGASAPTALTDAQNLSHDPPHGIVCMLSAMQMAPSRIGTYHGVLYDSAAYTMSRYAEGGSCSKPQNFAYAPADAIEYHAWAKKYAIADHFFQSVAGASAANDMYFARGRFVLFDNDIRPEAIGEYHDAREIVTLYDVNIADLLLRNGISFGMFIEGYDAAVAAAPNRPSNNAPGCRTSPDPPSYPCIYDASDVPFAYYASIKDDPGLFKDYAQFAGLLDAGRLPTVSYVRSYGFHSEHPGSSKISEGTKFIQNIIDATLASPIYANQTLILVVPDESGGFFDHVAPPPRSFVDHKPYGPPTSFVAIGKPGTIVKPGTVSHAPMEPTSILRFIEWNWFGGATGQLAGRDAVAGNLGSVLAPSLGVPQ